MSAEVIPWIYLGLVVGLIASLYVALSRQFGGTIRLVGLGAFFIIALVFVMICWGKFMLPGRRLL